MKLLLAISLSLFTGAALACTNFTGTYKSSRETVYSIKQSGCESFTITDNSGVHEIIADGQRRVQDTDEIKLNMAATFVGNNLTLDALIEYSVPMPSDIPVEVIPARLLIIQTKNYKGDIVSITTMFNSAGLEIGTDVTTDQKI